MIKNFPLGLGGSNLGNIYAPISEHQAHELLDTAWQEGLRYFDTAPHYGLGLSEKRMGAYLAQKKRDEFVISTKVGRVLVPNEHPVGDDMANAFAVPDTLRRQVDHSYDGVRRSLEQSLARLGLDYVDVVYLHDPDEAPQGLEAATDEGIASVVRLRNEGLVKTVGIGSKSVTAMIRAVKTGEIDVVMNSGRYTLLEQPALPELMPLCEQYGVDMVAVSVFNSGLLARPEVLDNTHYEYGTAPADVIQRARDIAAVCQRHGVELPTAALAYVMRHPVVQSELVSASRGQRIRESVARARQGQQIPADLWQELADQGLIPAGT